MIYEILWEPQKQAVDFIVNQRRVLLADQPGSGKTLMTLAALEIDGCFTNYRDWETDRKSTRLNSSHSRATRMPSSA